MHGRRYGVPTLDGYCESGLITEANVHEVGEGLTRYLDSEKWSRDDGRYIESFDKWIGGKKWRDRPNPAQRRGRTGGSRNAPATGAIRTPNG